MEGTKTALCERLGRFGFFARFPKNSLQYLARSACIRDGQAGEYLWHQGQLCQYAFFIEEGLVVTSRRIREGTDRTYGLHGPGDSLGLYAIWAGMQYPTDALVLNEGMVAIQIESKVLEECVAQEPQIATLMLAEISRFTEALIGKIEIVSAGTVARRVAKLMHVLLQRYGVSTADNTWYLPFRMTLEQIGGIVDSRLETVARVLSKWKRQGWLAIGDDGLRFYGMDHLAALLAEEGS